MISRLSSLVCIFLMIGCDSATPSEDLVAVRDSSGVRIVEHTAFPRDLPRYSLDLSEATTFDPRETGLDLFGVRSAFVDAEGDVVVADGGNFRILRFEPSDEVISSTGRNGQGLGEFGKLTLVSRWMADSLLAWDVNARRLSVFASDGTFARTFRLELTDSILGGFVQDVFEDGSFLGTGFTDTGGPIPTGRHRYPAPAYHFASDGSFRANLGLIPGTEIYFEAIDRGFRTSPALFSRYTQKIACRNQLVIASNDRVFTDRGGRVWLEDYQVVEGETTTWRVFGQDGAVLFTAEMPKRFDPTGAGEDYVLGVFRDPFDVESVVLASLAPVPE